MPSESVAFTTRVEPVSPPWPPAPIRRNCRRELVEAPGTAPGSATLIPQAVYRHSRLPDNRDIGCAGAKRNRAFVRAYFLVTPAKAGGPGAAGTSLALGPRFRGEDD